MKFMTLVEAYRQAKKDAKCLFIPSAVIKDRNEYYWVTAALCIRYREKKNQLVCVFDHFGNLIKKPYNLHPRK